MQIEKALAVFVLCNSIAVAQQFAVSTFAGGGPLLATPAPALNVAIGQPQGAAISPAGDVFFTALNSVLKIDSNGLLTSVAGTGSPGFSGDGGPATSASLTGPTALALDAAGNLYIADAGAGRVRQVSTQGIITTIAGSGTGGYNNGVGDGGSATAAPLFYPYQLAVDPAGRVYIGEWNTPRVRRVSADGIITTVVGNGMTGYSGDGGPATSAEIGAPWGLAFDSAGNLYVSDAIPGDDIEPTTTHIRKVTPDGIITTVAGAGPAAYAGDGGPAASAQFDEPGPLAVDRAGNIYVPDGDHIRRISTDGVVTSIAGNGTYGYSGDGGPAVSAEISSSIYGQGLGLATDGAGNLYFADSGNNRVRKISPDGIIATVAGNGGDGCCYSGDGGPATSAQLYAPVGVAADSGGNVYIADTFNNRVRKVSPAGVITTAAGDGTPIPGGDGGPAADAQVHWPAGLAFDGSGNLYVADCANQRVRKISPDGIITTVAGNGVAGFAGDGGAAVNAQLNWPKDVAVDNAGNLYIADTVNNRVRVVSPGGVISTVGDATSFIGPNGVTLDTAGNLYVSDAYRVQKVSPDGEVTTVAGNGGPGYSGDGGPAGSAQLVSPFGLKIDAAGNLYIADATHVRMVSPNGIITTVAAAGAWGLAIDLAGNLYAADPWSNVVRLLKASPLQ